MQSSSDVCVFFNPKPMLYVYPKVQPLLLMPIVAKSTPKVIKNQKCVISACISDKILQQPQLLLLLGQVRGCMQSIPQHCREPLYKTKLDDFFGHTYLYTMPTYVLRQLTRCADLCSIPKKHGNVFLDDFFHGHPYVLRCI